MTGLRALVDLIQIPTQSLGPRRSEQHSSSSIRTSIFGKQVGQETGRDSLGTIGNSLSAAVAASNFASGAFLQSLTLRQSGNAVLPLLLRGIECVLCSMHASPIFKKDLREAAPPCYIAIQFTEIKEEVPPSNQEARVQSPGNDDLVSRFWSKPRKRGKDFGVSVSVT